MFVIIIHHSKGSVKRTRTILIVKMRYKPLPAMEAKHFVKWLHRDFLTKEICGIIMIPDVLKGARTMKNSVIRCVNTIRLAPDILTR